MPQAIHKNNKLTINIKLAIKSYSNKCPCEADNFGLVPFYGITYNKVFTKKLILLLDVNKFGRL